ncbi:MAG: 4Fe-4S dicluster domain-containing protein [Gemmatimonadota bacterium]
MNNGEPETNGMETSRRDFLKVLGVAGAGAATVSCGPPDVGDKLIPYLVPPDDIVPGTNVTYSTVLAQAGPEPLGVHAKVRDGRVIKLEGNPDFPNRGALSALAQSALQDLYDPDRVPGPLERVGGDWNETTWEAAIEAAAAAVGAGRTLLLTPPVTGTAAEFYADWAAATGVEWVTWEPLGHEALRAAHEIAFGRAEIPTYDLAAADHVVSFGADFMATWLAPVELSGRYAEARSMDDGEPVKLTFVGPRLSLTGVNADAWLPARSGAEAALALAVAREVAERRGGGEAARVRSVLAPFTAEAVTEASGVPAEKIVGLGEELAAADAPVVLPPDVSGQGVYATEVHLAVALLNYVCGAVGRTVRFDGGPARGAGASYAEARELAARLRAGDYRTVVTAGVNPVYGLPDASGFAAALADVANHISLATHLDETAVTAGWILPSGHELESWGDVELRPGVFGLQQPIMRPVFDVRQREDILLAIAAAAGLETGVESYGAYLQAAWRDAAGGPDADFEGWWHEALSDGATVERPGVTPPAEIAPPLSAAAANHSFTMPESGDGLSLVLYPTAQFYDGRGANRSWMQELPDAVTKTVWNSWVELHPATAGPLGIETGDVVEVSTAAGSVEAPAYVHEGMRPDIVALPLGQGHTEYGRTAAGRGVNPVELLDGTADPRSGALAYTGAAVEVTAAGRRDPLPVMQGNETDLDREIGELISVDTALAAAAAHEIDLTELVEAAWDSDPNSPYRWGMTIDLNACNGCGACVTACYAENNIPTVGEDLCAQGREMSWMQIMSYREETEDGERQTVHVPVLCQQCGDAPCEPVCPVYATYHNPEGLNAQIYNRCVGTRYCSNNCPYKVRRFNWYTYEDPYPLDLQLNPDVTVRQKGVMEKCTFCVQRINRAKLDAKEAGRPVADGEVTTACMQTCPTQAIHFGNLKDPESTVSRIAKGPRGYGMLEELNTRPAITYLKSVTWAPIAEGGHHGDGHGGDGEGADHGAEAPSHG